MNDQSVFVLGKDGNLWYTPAPFGQVPNPKRLQVDTKVGNYWATDDQHLFVLGEDDNLWYTPAPFGQVPNRNRQLVAEHVLACEEVGTATGPSVFVLDVYANLWFISGPPFGQAPQLVDKNVNPGLFPPDDGGDGG
jgi:hypothetical protein